METGLIRPITLSDSEKAEITTILTTCHAALATIAESKYGEPKVCRLRDEYKANPNNVPLEARPYLAQLAGMEERVLQGFILVAAPICQAFDIARDDHPRITLADMMQLAAISIYDAMYKYDGSRGEFSTLVYWAVKNRMLDEVRKEKPIVLKDDQEDLVAQEQEDQIEALKWDAINAVQLKGEEQKLFDAFRGGMTLREMGRRFVNPSTGRLYSPQRISQILQVVFKQIRAVYERRAA